MGNDKPIRALLIDDDPHLLFALKSAMKRAGFETLTAASGDEGLQRARQDHPDIIVCDVMMPPPDGWQLRQMLAEDPATARIPFIFVTGCTDAEDRLAGLSKGADDYITKPFKPQELVERVRAVLRRYEAGRQQGLAEAGQKIDQAQKMQAIGELAGGIAHDFNNLLAIIMGNLELLHEQLARHPDLYELALQALRAVDRGTALTRRLLIFARRQSLQGQPTDLNKLVLGMIELIRRTLGATIQVETALAPDLEQVMVDPAQLESALLNLVINARDAMPQAGRLVLETATATLDADEAATLEDVQPGAYVVLSVSDSGVGMTPEVLKRVFEPFFTTKGTSKGNGLGLSMVYGLVKQSNGHITIDSEPGQGTTVRLYLPMIPAQTSGIAEHPATAARIEGDGETILVVEDDPDVRLFAVNALHSLGYQTCQAGDARTALELLDALPQIALLFTDIVLPGDMNGIQLATEAALRRPDLPILFTSGYTERVLVREGAQAEGVEMLAKPYRKADLGLKLCALLSGRRQ